MLETLFDTSSCVVSLLIKSGDYTYLLCTRSYTPDQCRGTILAALAVATFGPHRDTISILAALANMWAGFRSRPSPEGAEMLQLVSEAIGAAYQNPRYNRSYSCVLGAVGDLFGELLARDIACTAAAASRTDPDGLELEVSPDVGRRRRRAFVKACSRFLARIDKTRGP
ncbi:hypothetical protein TruAng_001671 [Truncatella angustata]|nr:hypothetical protein TruAng_001671 [Truncatella angustata]